MQDLPLSCELSHNCFRLFVDFEKFQVVLPDRFVELNVGCCAILPVLDKLTETVHPFLFRHFVKSLCLSVIIGSLRIVKLLLEDE